MVSTLFILSLLVDPPPAPLAPPAPTETVVAAPAAAPLPPATWRAYGAVAANVGPGDGVGAGQVLWLQLERAGIEGGRWVLPQVRLSGVAEVGFGAKDERDTADNPKLAGNLFVRQVTGAAETSILDLRVGVTWLLFGADDTVRPATVQLRGLPGQVAARGMQAQTRHIFRGATAELEIAAGVAPIRPEAQSPDWQGRVRFAWNGWRGVHTSGSAFTREEPLSITVSGLFRRLTGTLFDSSGASSATVNGGGVSLDLLLPVLPARLGQRAHALTFTGSAMLGRGIADLYSTATQEVVSTINGQRTTYRAPGAIGDTAGVRADQLYAIDTRSLVLGLLYRPPRGPVWASVNYGRVHNDEVAPEGVVPYASPLPASPAAGAIRGVAPVRDFQAADVNLFLDPLPYLRVGAGYQWLGQTFSEGTERTIHRLSLSVVGFI